MKCVVVITYVAVPFAPISKVQSKLALPLLEYKTCSTFNKSGAIVLIHMCPRKQCLPSSRHILLPLPSDAKLLH